MKNIKKYYKDSFNIFKSDEEIEEKNIKKIFYNHEIKKINILKKCIAMFLIFISFSCGTVFGIGVVKKFNTLNVDVKDNKPYISSNAKKEINYEAEFNECADREKCEQYKFNLKDIEEKLNIKIVKNNNINDSVFIPYKIEKNNGYYSKMGFIAEWIDCDEYMIARYLFSFNTKYDTEGTINDPDLPFSNSYKTIYSQKLDTDILVSDEGTSFRLAFDYDDIHYNILLFVKSKEDCISVVEKFINTLA